MFIIIGSMIMPAISPGWARAARVDGVEVAERHDDGSRRRDLGRDAAVLAAPSVGCSGGPDVVERRGTPTPAPVVVAVVAALDLDDLRAARSTARIRWTAAIVASVPELANRHIGRPKRRASSRRPG